MEVLMKYHASLGGFLVAFSGAKFSSPDGGVGSSAYAERGADGKVIAIGRIAGEQPVVSARVTSEVLLFRPTLGAILRGRVSHVGDGHIGLLVAGLFNASILVGDMAGGYSWNDSGAEAAAWVATPVWTKAAENGVAASGSAAADESAGKKRRRGNNEGANAKSGIILSHNPSTIGVGDVIVFRVRGMSHGSGVFVIHGSFEDQADTAKK
jgi:hypothetical protein